ncbi:hypothetical protein B0J17DRAFT_351792 [Rhizoctonia solani]|nr:hypothetical protein B0J17DRAFT_351792 [Rhizoctonia solani]
MLAHYDSRISDAIGRRACTADTREETLTKIEEWCDDPTSPMIYWMNGMAGTGKTTIAYTLARKLESRGQLGASFFCTVTSKECRDAGSIVPTIAHQLSYRSTPFQAALVEVLKQHPNAATLTIPKQVERLLLDPLDAVGNNMAQNLVVIIDALDECHNSNVVGLILDSLFTSTGRLPIKFFITSRPEPGIYEKLAAQSNDLRSVLHLHEVCEDSIQRDIRRFLQEGLKLIHPSEDEIEKLTALSGRLFIFAATAVRYIVPESTPVDSRARLKIMLEVNSKSTKIHSDIDALYHAILSGATDNDNFKLEPEERENVLSVLWAVVCSLHPVSFVGLTVRAGLDGEAAVLAALAPLESVLHVSHTDDTISIFHASFPQFIFDQSRSNNFFCDIAIISRTTTLRCLRIINAQLPSSIEPDTAMSPYLNYAANNFSIPLVADGSALPGTEEICSELRNFFENRFESWLWLVTNHKGLGEHTHVELIRVLLGWLVMVIYYLQNVLELYSLLKINDFIECRGSGPVEGFPECLHLCAL